MLLARYVPLTDGGIFLMVNSTTLKLKAKLVFHRKTLNRTVILMFGGDGLGVRWQTAGFS